jgi:hypothetical protein
MPFTWITAAYAGRAWRGERSDPRQALITVAVLCRGRKERIGMGGNEGDRTGQTDCVLAYYRSHTFTRPALPWVWI